MTHFALELHDMDITLILDSSRATLARGNAQGVTFEVAELENLLDRLRIASELYAVTESLCGPLREPAPTGGGPSAVPARPPVALPRLERLPRRAPAPPLPPVAEDRQEPPRAVLVITTEEAETWRISETVRRRRRLTEPGTLTVGADRVAAPEGDTQDQTPAGPRPRAPLHLVPDAPRPPEQPPRPATAAPPIEQAPGGPGFPPVSSSPPAPVSPTAQSSTRLTGAAAAAGGSAGPAAASPPARPEAPRAAGPDAAGTDKPGAYIPPLPKGGTRPPQLTDVMVHFLKHNGPSTLDDAVRYVKSLRLWPAAMNLRLSVTIALQKSSCGFTKLRDGRYALDPEAH